MYLGYLYREIGNIYRESGNIVLDIFILSIHFLNPLVPLRIVVGAYNHCGSLQNNFQGVRPQWLALHEGLDEVWNWQWFGIMLWLNIPIARYNPLWISLRNPRQVEVYTRPLNSLDLITITIKKEGKECEPHTLFWWLSLYAIFVSFCFKYIL